MRKALFLLALLFIARPAFAQSPSMATYIDDLYQYSVMVDGEPHDYIAPIGWAVGNGFRPGVGIYIDGRLAEMPFTWTRGDVCPAVRAWGWACDDEQSVTCDDGVNSQNCVGYIAPVDVTTRYGSGWHSVAFAAFDSNTLTVAFSNERPRQMQPGEDRRHPRAAGGGNAEVRVCDGRFAGEFHLERPARPAGQAALRTAQTREDPRPIHGLSGLGRRSADQRRHRRGDRRLPGSAPEDGLSGAAGKGSRKGAKTQRRKGRNLSFASPYLFFFAPLRLCAFARNSVPTRLIVSRLAIA